MQYNNWRNIKSHMKFFMQRLLNISATRTYGGEMVWDRSGHGKTEAE